MFVSGGISQCLADVGRSCLTAVLACQRGVGRQNVGGCFKFGAEIAQSLAKIHARILLSCLFAMAVSSGSSEGCEPSRHIDHCIRRDFGN